MCAASSLEVDETFVGGKERNKHAHKKLNLGRGLVGKVMVVGMKDRTTNTVTAEVAKLGYRWIGAPDIFILRGFVRRHAQPGATVFTDMNRCYRGMKEYDHYAVNRRVKRVLWRQAHTNGIESFWSTIKRGYKGVYHYMSFKHLHRYVNEYAGRHNMRSLETIDKMEELVEGFEGKRLTWKKLTKGSEPERSLPAVE